jgi:hypothetical protein
VAGPPAGEDLTVIGRRLDRHVLRSFLGPYAACLAGLAGLMVIFDLFENVDDCFALFTRPDVGGSRAPAVIGTYYAGRVLSFLAAYGGLAFLAGAALAVAVLHRNGELTAVRAAGVSLRRAFLPLLLAAVLAGALQVAVAEWAVVPLAPAADDAYDVIRRRTSRRGLNVAVSRRSRLAVWAAGPSGAEQPVWRGKAHLDFRAGRTAGGGRLVAGLQADMVLDAPEAPGAPLAYLLKAESARWQDGAWQLRGGRFWRWGAPVAECARLSCEITPTDLEARALGLAAIDSGGLWELRNDTPARLEIWQRLAPPLANLILMLVGLPLAVAGSARGGRLLPLVLALMLGALYLLAGELGAQAARGGELLGLLERFKGGDWLAAMGGPLRMAVDLAMGLPHLAFLAAGAALYWRVER